MPTNTATRSRRSGQRGGGRRQAAVPADVKAVQAEIERQTASIGQAITQLVQTLPDTLAEDQTAAATDEPADKPNRATRREAERQARAEESEQRGLLAEIEGRNRKQLIPHYVTASLLGLAEAIHALSAQVQATSAAAVIAGAAVAGAGAAGLWLLRKRQQLLDGWMVWAGMLSSAVAVWMVVAVLHGVTWGTFAAALAAEYAFGARWWNHVRHEQPTGLFDDITEEIATEPVVIDHELIATFARRWAEKIGCSGGVLAGSALTSHTEFDHGIEYVLRLVGGKQDLDTVLASLSKIASGLEHPAIRLIAEPFLNEDGEENPSLVKFTVVTSSPVKDDVFFREPVIRRGYIPIGPYADGRGMAAYQLFKKKRLLNGMVVGGTGSGKSRLLELIGLVAMWTGYIYVIHADGMNGASCPMLWEHCEHYGREDADTLLDRMEAMQSYREVELGRQKKSGFRPSREFPGVLVIMDEAHRMITDKNWMRWCNLAREINKLGMGLLCADQDAKLSTWKDGTMRASLQAGNGIGLRVKDRAAGQIMDSGGFNLFDLPKTPGTGYVMESDDPEARQAPYRGQWLPDEDDAYPEDEETGVRTTERQVPADVVLIEQWYAQAKDRHVELDRGTREAKDKAGRRRPGAGAGGQQTAPASTPAAATGAQSAAAALPSVPAPSSAPALGLPTVPAPAAASAAAPSVSGLSDVEQRILAAVQEGIDKPGAIAKHIEMSRQYVASGLRTLGERGLVDKTGAGPAVRYQATSRGQVA